MTPTWFDTLLQDFFYFYGIIFFIVGTLWFLAHRKPVHNPYALSIVFRNSRRKVMSDTTLPLPGPAVTATAVISQLNVPVPGAVFDAQPDWVIADATIASISTIDIMNEQVTPVAAGVTTLTLNGVYQGFALEAVAQVTVQLVNGGFALNIEWQTPVPPTAPAA